MYLRRIYSRKECGGFRFCGEDYDYALFQKRKPKQVAKDIIRSVFGDDVEDMFFYYWARAYRGNNNLQDIVEVYYKSKTK